jgi:HEAT repeat protein
MPAIVDPMGGGRRWLGAMVLLMGFAWPGQSERLVGELTRAVTPREKRDALRLLGTLESFPTEAVLPFTRDPDPGVRLEAYRLLGAPAQDPAPEVRALRPSLDDPDPLVRLAAVRAGPNETRALIARLEDEALDVRIEAARALAGRADAVPALRAHAEAALPELRAAVIDALAHGEPTAEVERLLRRALDDRDPDVVLAALRGYARHPQLARPATLRTLASGVHPQLARAARAQLASARTWDDPPWLVALERTPSADPIDALEATLPAGEARAIEPLRRWRERAPSALRPRIDALIERARAAPGCP